MRQLPEFITFTGVDDETLIRDMLELSRLYPIEWGVLLSPKRQGVEARYPSWPMIQSLVRVAAGPGSPNGLVLSAHLCGGYASEVVEHGHVRGVDAVLGRYFRRAQINHTEPDHETIALWAGRVGIQAIAQHRYRDGFTRSVDDVALLFDQSGGRGKTPTDWPMPDPTQLCGYAGGLTADNVHDVVQLIGGHADRYWLDMESGVRDELSDRFSLAKCRAVCEAVYGRSLFA